MLEVGSITATLPRSADGVDVSSGEKGGDAPRQVAKNNTVVIDKARVRGNRFPDFTFPPQKLLMGRTVPRHGDLPSFEGLPDERWASYQPAHPSPVSYHISSRLAIGTDWGLPVQLADQPAD